MEASAGDHPSARIAVSVNLTDVEESPPAGACAAADCLAHHRADGRARYFQFTLAEPKTVAITLVSGSVAALFVLRDTPRNGWGTVPGAPYEHRVKVRLVYGKLVRGDGNEVALPAAAGSYTVEAVSTSRSGTFTVSIAPG